MRGGVEARYHRWHGGSMETGVYPAERLTAVAIAFTASPMGAPSEQPPRRRQEALYVTLGRACRGPRGPTPGAAIESARAGRLAGRASGLSREDFGERFGRTV